MLKRTSLLFHLVVTLIYALMIGHLLFGSSGDWTAHVGFAERLLARDWRVIHVGFHGAIIILSAGIAPLLPIAAFIVGIVSANVTYELLRRWMRSAGYAFVALIVGPITVFTPAHQYFGYIPSNAVHSPTLVLLKPFALLLFLWVAHALETNRPPTLKNAAAMITLCVVSTFVKPNFALSLVPALAVVFAWRLLVARPCLTRSFVIWCVIVGGTLSATLASQYVAQYLWIDGEGGGIAVAPLAVLEIHGQTAVDVVVKFALSIAFPLTVMLLYRGSLALRLAWLIFAFGAAQMYLLSETGVRAGEGNFWWGAQVSLFVLFAAALVEFVRNGARAERWQQWVTWAVLALQVGSGIGYVLIRFLFAAQWVSW